jgi:hypothetical protein
MPSRAQNLANHARYVPMFHFVLSALLILGFYHWSRLCWESLTQEHVWGLIESIALLILGWYVRAFPVGVQDRVIRLEMRLRLGRVLSPTQFDRFDELSTPQVVALRFASDAELPGLVSEVLEGKLVRPGDIKKRIRIWQPDEQRI